MKENLRPIEREAQKLLKKLILDYAPFTLWSDPIEQRIYFQIKGDLASDLFDPRGMLDNVNVYVPFEDILKREDYDSEFTESSTYTVKAAGIDNGRTFHEREDFGPGYNDQVIEAAFNLVGKRRGSLDDIARELFVLLWTKNELKVDVVYDIDPEIYFSVEPGSGEMAYAGLEPLSSILKNEDIPERVKDRLCFIFCDPDLKVESFTNTDGSGSFSFWIQSKNQVK